MRATAANALVLFALAGCHRVEEPAGETDPTGGFYHVGSRVEDRRALGGFGKSDNYPRTLTDQPWGEKETVSVVAFPDEPADYFGQPGMTVRVVNRTAGEVAFDAYDSKLFLVREARDTNGEWREIEFQPDSGCGNGYHRVFLRPDEYWQFPARVYTGAIQTRLRFRLDLERRPDAMTSIFSAEFDGAVSAAQFLNR
jgi:hypothetical protein